MNLYAYVGNDPLNRVDPTGNAKQALDGLQTTLDTFTPGSEAFKNSYANYQAGNLGNSALWAAQGGLDIVAAAVTGGESQAIKGLIAGQGGRFASLVGTVGDDLTAHHIPQAAMKFTSRADGGAIVMTTAEHEATRTFGYKGAVTATQDAGVPFRDLLAKDIRDVRNIVGSRYNQGLQDVIQYYRQNFPDLIKKQ